MRARFYSDTPISGSQVLIQGPEAHHLLHVLRAAPGMQVILFDGQGDEFAARVQQTARRSVRLEVLQRLAVDRELRPPLTVGVALPKGERQRWLVEKMVELGAARLVPLVAGRGVAQPSTSALRRLQRYVIEASKQCGRNRLMELSDPVTSHQWLATAPFAARWIADPSGQPLGQIPLDDPASAAVAIGPEGGWTADELDRARHGGWQPTSLGPRILRVETAAALVAAWWNVAGPS